MGKKWDSVLTHPWLKAFFPGGMVTSPQTAMLALGVMSRPSYTEWATAEAVTLGFWLLLHLQVRLYHPGTHERDEDASSTGSSNCLYSGSLLLVAGRLQDPTVPHRGQRLAAEPPLSSPRWPLLPGEVSSWPDSVKPPTFSSEFSKGSRRTVLPWSGDHFFVLSVARQDS